MSLSFCHDTEQHFEYFLPKSSICSVCCSYFNNIFYIMYLYWLSITFPDSFIDELLVSSSSYFLIVFRLFVKTSVSIILVRVTINVSFYNSCILFFCCCFSSLLYLSSDVPLQREVKGNKSMCHIFSLFPFIFIFLLFLFYFFLFLLYFQSP